MSESISERPATFAQAFAQESPASASLPDTPSVDATPTDPPADATVPPVEAAPTDAVSNPSPEPTKGEPPKERWDAILENARAKTRAEVEAEYKQRFGWAESVSPQEIQQLQQWGRAFTTDPVGWLAQSITEVGRTHPHLVPSLRSEAARILADRSIAASPQVDTEPDVPVLDQNGQVVTRTYSAERMKAVVQQAIQDYIGKEVAPIKQAFQKREAQDYATAQERAAAAAADALYKDYSGELPDFEALKPEIGKYLAELSHIKDDGRALVAAWKKAYTAKQAEEAKTRDATSKTQVLDDLKTKARASMPNPASAAVPSAKRPASFLDKGLAWQ